MIASQRETIASLIFAAGFGLILSGKMLLFAWEAETTMAISSLITTQRKRYVSIILANIIAALFLYPVYKYGFHECIEALRVARNRVGMFGWFLTIIFYWLLATPVISLLVAWSVYRHPAFLAKSSGKWYSFRTKTYFRTEDVRSGNKPYTKVEPHTRVVGGTPSRYYREKD